MNSFIRFNKGNPGAKNAPNLQNIILIKCITIRHLNNFMWYKIPHGRWNNYRLL